MNGNLVQRDRGTGVTVNSWSVGSDGYIKETQRIYQFWTGETGFQALAEFRRLLEKGEVFRSAGFAYRIES